jgi:AAA domain-containing protein
MAFQKATKFASKLRLALAGPSGSGKTFTALTLATALAGGGEVAVIDTERGSASKYADQFLFDVQELESFHPNNYINAIHEAEAAGYAVLVIDSLSHAWNGPGGLLEQVENITKRSKNGSSFNAWGEATPLQNRLIDAITRSKLHIICTMRTKTEYVIEPNAYGKSAPRKVGTAPIQRQDVEYEFDVYGDMDIDNTLIIHKSRCSELAGQVIAKPDGRVADMLKRWLAGEPAPERPISVKDAYEMCMSSGLVRTRTDFYQKASEMLGRPITTDNVMSLEQDALRMIVASAQMAQAS